MHFLALVTIGLLSSNGQAQDNGLTVQTQQGDVTGTLVSSTVRQFLGVPYAVANRWEAPQPPPSRSATLEATSFSDSCVQSLTASAKEFLSLAGLGNQSVQESEDCLSVNIWAPSSERKQSTAVMLWIYGGGFEFGTSNTVFYDGQNLVRDNDDVIVVTFNYRLNIFGQPNAPQLISTSQSQNFGFLDLDAVVQWVHANIAAFGGDPERITLFGQSAGSGMADAYTYSHPTDTLVKGVIEESGSIAGMPQLTPPGQPFSPTAWNAVASVVGCGNATTPAQFSCMQAVPFRTLENAVISTSASFGPMQDGITYFSDSDARSAAGNFLHVPLLIGNTAQEGDIFIVAMELLGMGAAIPVLTQVASDLVTQLVFNCPVGTTAGDRVKAGVPTWRYRYEAVFPDISSRPDLRAFHASEIPIVFGTYRSSSFTAPPTNVEIALSKYVQEAWVAFARDPAHGLTNYGWPMYNPNTASLAQLGNFFNQSGVLFAQGAAFDTGCVLTETAVSLVTQIISLFGSIL